MSDTDMVLAASKAAAAGQHLFVTSGATSPRLPDQVPTYLYLACFGDTFRPPQRPDDAYNDLGAQTAMVIFRSGDTYTELLQGYFTTRFTQLDG
ncbi:MAG: hypothetical protein R3C44_15575 [Chloroflexota bacterium]